MAIVRVPMIWAKVAGTESLMGAERALMEAASVTRPSCAPRVYSFGRGVLNQSLNVYAGLALLYLLFPIAIIILFSFNDTQSRFNFTWQGFTLKNGRTRWGAGDRGGDVELGEDRGARDGDRDHPRHDDGAGSGALPVRGRGPTNLFIFIPLATPEVVLGASLLSLFLSVGYATGFTTILIAHVMFSISFVVVTVRSRLIGFDRYLEEAAQDLGANGLQTFLRVTLPLIAPASSLRRCSRSRSRSTTS